MKVSIEMRYIGLISKLLAYMRDCISLEVYFPDSKIVLRFLIGQKAESIQYSMRILIALIVLIGILFVIITMIVKNNTLVNQKVEPIQPTIGLRYVAIGDSYTIGQGVAEIDRWPNVLNAHLNEAGFHAQLVANTGVSGYTVENVLEFQMERIVKENPDFVTVLIGANDCFVQKSPEIYRQDLQRLLDRLQTIVTIPRHIVLITIPDFTKSPAFSLYEKEEMLSLIEQYNAIIREEGVRRDFTMVDIFPVSQTMTSDEDYIFDGLHPSAQGYAKWERVILPAVSEILKEG